MNIGDRHLCSKCLREIEEYDVCPYCGFNPDAPVEPFCIEEGTLFQNGRYELGAVIGRGGFGITYAAWDYVLDIPVAIKEYFPAEYCKRDASESDEVEITNKYFYIGLQTFIREARILATLHNISSVVQVYDCFEKNNTAYIIMEYVRGETLLEYSRRRKITSAELLKLLRPLFDDLIRVHKFGVLHRDISPNNILIKRDGSPKLIDFGAAMNLKDSSVQNPSFNLSFAAPEQYTIDGNEGFWTDVYGLSATIYTVMTGKIIQNAQSRLEDDKVKKPAYVDKISKRIMKGVFLGLNLDTHKRTQSIEDLRADIYHLRKPLVTKKQKILYAAKIILLIAAIEGGLYFVIIGIGDKVFEQVFYETICRVFNDADLAYELAQKYEIGIQYTDDWSISYGYHQNLEKSLYWYKWAADRGNQDAMFDYAVILQNGEITEKDIPSAISYYEKSACEDIPLAWNNLGVIYMNGDGVEKDEEKAFEYFEKAAEYDESGLAQANLGILYEEGIAVEKNVEKAVEYYKEADILCGATGMYRLALCYNYGIGVEQNDVECIRLLYEAAEYGSPEAMCAIGNLYEEGLLGNEDHNKSFDWYYKAIELNYGGGYYGWSHWFQTAAGDSTRDFDIYEISENMRKAAELGYEPAYEEVLQMAEDRYGIFDDEETAEEVISKYGSK